MSKPGEYEHLTDVELARDAWLAIIRNDDAVSDSVSALYSDAAHMASALYLRLRGPYCEIEGCGLLHGEHFPWCPWHQAEHFATPLPSDFPPYPGNAP